MRSHRPSTNSLSSAWPPRWPKDDHEISGAEELRVKESDRIATMAGELRAMGARITEKPDGMVIEGLGSGTEWDAERAHQCTSHGDHRVAMSAAIGGADCRPSDTASTMRNASTHRSRISTASY